MSSGALAAEEVSALRHDLRTPVNHIVGYCELLLEDSTGSEHAGQRAALEEALDAVRGALELINRALPASGRDVARGDVDALYTRLGAPHARIMAALDALLAPGSPPRDAGFTADVQRIREAANRLAGGSSSGPTRSAPAPGVGAPGAAAAGRSGTTPAARRPMEAAPPAAVTSPASVPEPRGTILVVDDEPENRAVLQRHLERQGYRVACAAGGAEALAMVHRTSYDLVLLDVRMPEIDGHEVLARLKGDGTTRDIPVVVISAADDLSTVAACIEAGADDFLSKPFDPVILRARVSASVEKKHLRNLETDYLREVERVAAAANAVEQGSYVAGSLAEVAARDDALGRLARVFDAMAAGVRAREERLRGQVGHLRREIDEARQATAAPREPDGSDGDGLVPGELLANRYHVVRVIGSGGMGRVYKVRDRELAEDIALKVLRTDALSADPTMIERFKTEIRLARRISHRNVVRTHDLGEHGGTYFVTMEYVEGITVRDLIDMRGHLSTSATLGIAQQLAAALEVAHEEGVVHRDIKPQNLLLDPDGVLKVMDFGIARLAARTSTLTQAGMLIGTPVYMAPEQLLAESADHRSDLYMAGVVLYECLIGDLPFQAASPIALIARVLHAEPVAPAARDPQVPLPLSSLVMRLLAKEPDDRPSSATELRELLAAMG